MKPKFIPLITAIDCDFYKAILTTASDTECSLDFDTVLMMIGL
jgi:hypothetical protein